MFGRVFDVSSLEKTSRRDLIGPFSSIVLGTINSPPYMTGTGKRAKHVKLTPQFTYTNLNAKKDSEM